MSRRELIGEAEFRALLPDPGLFGYLVSALEEIGVCDVVFRGDGLPFCKPLPWREIMAWPGISSLARYEINLIRLLSEDFVSTRNDPNTRQPWSPFDGR